MPQGTMAQIAANQSTCPACGAGDLAFAPILHHMICAYVGPSYDFVETSEGYLCPKCRHGIASGDPACEILGTSARCGACGSEMIVSPRSALSRS
ncbi:hypothetical protein [Bradyrhizobium liaoningense]|uniref:TackOD1 domain-containing metal-binding protein n=2 Tax=Bradyrhizobium liaoningense TaxID=43992 RepID=UPI001BA6FA3B|nr:hypothetical protein [Bradyrhizobium liaoningense]MBR0854564.1 hypothetical protein [Bradyrhizobium liaoningense]